MGPYFTKESLHQTVALTSITELSSTDTSTNLQYAGKFRVRLIRMVANGGNHNTRQR